MRSYAASVARQDLCVRGKSPKRALKSKRGPVCSIVDRQMLTRVLRFVCCNLFGGI
jgi:hypothetical protein